MSIDVSRIGVNELDQLRDIGIRSYLPHYTHLWKPGGVEWYLERCFGDDNLRNELPDPNIEYYIIKRDGENIGILKLVLKKALPGSGIENALYLEKIYFTKEWTGKGLGRAAIEFTVRRAIELNRDYVWLMAMDTAAKPIAAYQRSGFEIGGYTNLGDEFELMKEEFRGMAILVKAVQ